MAIFRKKHCHCSRAFIHGSILIKLPTNVKYDNILMHFEFEGLGPRSRSQWLFFENIVIALAPSFVDRFCCNLTQMFSMKNILIFLCEAMLNSV